MKYLLPIALLASVSITQAEVTPEQAARLMADLTPFGAERAGNEAGTIPEWTGGLKNIPADYQGAGHHYVDPFPDDKPLFIINKDNLEQYKDMLTQGYLALFEAYADTFNMPVYQTRRTAGAPDWVYESMHKNARQAELAKGGNGVINAIGGSPFPIPQNGLEAIWNHTLRWKYTGMTGALSSLLVQENGDFTRTSTEFEIYYPYNDPALSYDQLNNTIFKLYARVTSPASRSGNIALIHETLDQTKKPRQAWVYQKGQRRVRKAPTIRFDAPVANSDGLVLTDEVDLWNGSPERYDWTLVGKKEMLIPYNAYRIALSDVKYQALVMKGHVNPEYTRFELHRVWVVEARLKEGQTHVYGRRLFYLDEDSWTVALTENYDRRDQLWRVGMQHNKYYYDKDALSAWGGQTVFHDLNARRYVMSGFSSEEATVYDYSWRPKKPKSHFTVQALRRRAR